MGRSRVIRKGLIQVGEKLEKQPQLNKILHIKTLAPNQYTRHDLRGRSAGDRGATYLSALGAHLSLQKCNYRERNFCSRSINGEVEHKIGAFFSESSKVSDTFHRKRYFCQNFLSNIEDCLRQRAKSTVPVFTTASTLEYSGSGTMGEGIDWTQKSLNSVLQGSRSLFAGL
ncbi:hypothetical protein ACFE04_000020 [Oxalis oulophora]